MTINESFHHRIHDSIFHGYRVRLSHSLRRENSTRSQENLLNDVNDMQEDVVIFYQWPIAQLIAQSISAAFNFYYTCYTVINTDYLSLRIL